MAEPLVLSYTPPDRLPPRGEGLLPFVEVEIESETHIMKHLGLLDSGATICVIPFSMGKALGLQWSDNSEIKLSGNLSDNKTCDVTLLVSVQGFEPVPCKFSWASTDRPPFLLGQRPFFELFDITFHGSRKMFQISPAASV